MKRLQAEYLVHRVDNFLEQHHLSRESAPVFLAGDYNSVPTSEIYNMMTKGFLYSLTDRARPTGGVRREGWCEFDDIVSYGADTKFLCDSSLSRLCRWMRVLGIDTKIIPSASDLDNSNMLDNSNTNGKKGTRRKGAFVELFELARNEKRVILTTSKTMRERAACPPSFLVSTRNLEQALVEVIREYGLILNQEKFLTVCGKCGGDIEACSIDDPRMKGKNTVVPPTDRELFCCVQCHQPYWWSERENSSPARAMKMADKLYNTVVQQLGITTDMDVNAKVMHEVGNLISSEGSDDSVLKSGDVDHREIQEMVQTQSQEVITLTSTDISVTQDIEKLTSSSSSSSSSSSTTTTTTTGTSLDKLFASRNAVILAKPTSSSSSSTIFEQSTPSPPVSSSLTSIIIDNNHVEGGKFSPIYRSAYAALHGKEATTTNWSMDFKDTLDYVFISDAFTVNQAVVIPSIPSDHSNSESQHSAISSQLSKPSCASHPIKTMEDLLAVTVDTAQPSEIWPSDHFLLLFDLSINPQSQSHQQSSDII